MISMCLAAEEEPLSVGEKVTAGGEKNILK